MTSFKMKNNTFTAKVATVDTKATGNPAGHLTAKTGEMIVTFPFDCGGVYSGHQFSIVLPSDVFYREFDEVAEKKTAKKKDES